MTLICLMRMQFWFDSSPKFKIYFCVLNFINIKFSPQISFGFHWLPHLIKNQPIPRCQEASTRRTHFTYHNFGRKSYQFYVFKIRIQLIKMFTNWNYSFQNYIFVFRIWLKIQVKIIIKKSREIKPKFSNRKLRTELLSIGNKHNY